ncbi:DUF5979 domain-containing protein [Agromyces ramosus]|uniref:DUF5979 domain-containing protein n=1 Tax=Agromyces ramosus TaxID=33879 RepID=UPI0027D78BA9|nr:DUF5979 domain-containing protein [Agromyces ramosus]
MFTSARRHSRAHRARHLASARSGTTRSAPWYQRLGAVAVAIVLALLAGLMTATPAVAAEAALTVQKVVDGAETATHVPGDEFTYTITVGCDDTDCVDAELVDEVPAAFEGFEILGTSVRPSSQPATVELDGCDGVASADCTLRATFEQPLDAGGVGIRAGDTYQLTLTLKVPQDLAPTWAFNGQPVPNTATATATTADTVTDAAEVTIDIARQVDVEISKTWTPAAQQFQPGVPSTVELAVRNASNVHAASLVLQDPATAIEGATELEASNPFRIVDFTGFGDVTAPAGSDTVTVDAYVYNAGSWTWISGAPSPAGEIALPDGVDTANVGGLRLTFTSTDGDAITADGTAGLVPFEVVQRATDRVSDAPLVLGAQALNEVDATVHVSGADPVTKSATAPYAITGLDVQVQATKSITPARIPAGTTATATVGAKNTSNGPLSSLVVADDDYFTEDLRFGGFTAPLSFPEGATDASLTWTFSDGTRLEAPVAAGETPGAPTAPDGAHLTGFAVEYGGSIAPGAIVNLSFAIDTAPDLVESESGSPERTTNTVDVTGTNPAGAASAEASAPLDVFIPDISLAIDKKLSPAQPVTAGGTVVAQLPTTTGTDSAYVSPNRIVIEDTWRDDEPGDFWNAFNPVAIAPTQVLSGSTLTVEALVDGDWEQIAHFAPAGPTEVFSGDLADLAPGVDGTSITGLRYTFEHPTGFAAGTTVSPNTVFQARSELRDGSGPTAVADAAARDYENLAVAGATGVVAGGTPVTSDDVQDVADARVIAYAGDGSLVAGKTWNPSVLSSQSGTTATSTLGWGVMTSGYDSVTIADPNGGESAPEETVFQAFDLQRISASSDAKWKWDTVTSIELYAAGTWQQLAAPGGSWMTGDRFAGYTLNPAQSAATTGVRITVVPNDAARAASSDPLRPQPGSGVAPSAAGQLRTVDLVWQLRNTVRVPDAAGRWATATHGYNDADPATIWNTVGVSGVLRGTPVGPATDRDDLTLVDQQPAVKVQKQVSRTVVPIPVAGEVPADGYPSVDYRVTAVNDSASRASYLRVTDPMPCSDATIAECASAPSGWGADPFAEATYDPDTNPFERMNLTDVTFGIPANAGVDRDASLVTLWRLASDGTMTTDVASLAAVDGFTAAQLADVVGVSVRYQGADPASTGGTIRTGAKLAMTLRAQLRVTERSSAQTVIEPVVVANGAFAQSYDPVLFPGNAPYDDADADLELVDGVLDVTAKKTITPGSLLEKDRLTPVAVRLEATDGEATVAAQQVTVEDADPGFWSRFRLTTLGQVDLPAGSDRVRVDVQLGGADEWIEGTPAPAAALPAVDVAEITGLRFVFARADGAVFSTTAPPAGWQATAEFTVQLLDAVRGTGDAVPFPGSVDNAIDTTSSRDDAELYAAATADASDDLELRTGTYALDVAKAPADNVHTVEAATTVPWTLRFTNSGSGYLTIDRLVDTLPTSLEPDFGVEPAYRTSNGGTLATDVDFSYDSQTRAVAFTWPDGGRRMAPGETFEITLGIVLKPGLSQGQRATNQFVVTTVQQLAACTNTSGNGQGVLAGLGASQCGTTNFVEPIPGASLATFKGVKGEIDGSLVDGAVNVVTPGGPCITDTEGYYRSPCAANTVIGATDAWKLEAINSGTLPYTSMTLVEPLPFTGDRMLATGGSRGSTYRPILDGSAGLDIAAPDGATVRWQVSTDAAVCTGGGSSTWSADPTCTGNSWSDSTAFTGDWADVTGLRVLVDFSTTAGGALAPGGNVTVRYQTVNTPASDADPGLAPVDVPVTGNFAWNQFGTQAVLTDRTTLRRAPVKAGVTLVGGPLEVRKAITGDAIAYAPDEVLIDLVCVVAGETLDLGDSATLTLTESGDWTASVEGIPLGADCTITEQGPVGEFGETSRTGSPATIEIRQTTAGGTVPAAQTAVVTNVYDFGSLSVTKAVDTAATVGEFGPFAFTLQCTTLLGEEVALAASDRTFTLVEGATHTVTPGTLPVGAECTVDETDADGADSTTYAGDGVTDAGEGSAFATVAPATAVTVTNRFEAGTLSILKTVTGEGAADYGDGPFTAAVQCTYGDQPVYRHDGLAIVPDVPTLVDEVFPVGTVCEVNEVLTGGATEHENPPAIVIAGPEGDESVGAVTALVANDFRVGGLELIKERIGDGVEEFGTGPFEAQVVCTWQKDGETLTVPLADGGFVALSEDSDYRAAIAGIIVGAECTVTETDAGLATHTTLDPDGGIVTILDPVLEQEPATVVITNRFDVGQLSLDKTVDRGTVTIGDDVTYTVTVRNTGQIDARDLTVTDTLPAGASFVRAGPAAKVDGARAEWLLAELPVGGTAAFTITVRYAATGEYVNTATVTNPGGPWRAVEAQHACTDGSDASCAAVSVLSLATTGVDGIMPLLAITALAMLLGLLLLAARRRSRPGSAR